MSVHQMGLVWGLDLPKPLKFTLLALADHADHEGHGAHPGVPLLAWKTGDDRRTIQKHLRKLEALGLIEPVLVGGGLVRTGAGGKLVGRATVYRLHLDNGDKMPPFNPRDLSTVESTTAAPRREKGGATVPRRAAPHPPQRQEPSRTSSRAPAVDNPGDNSQ